MRRTLRKAGEMAESDDVNFSNAKVGLKLKEMTSYMGIAEDEPHLFWIAELALLAKLPPHWRQYKDEEGHAYFHNHATNVTSWQHPRDGYFFELVARERKKIKAMKQLADAQRRMKWDPDGRLEGIALSNGNTTALHASEGMYPSLRTGVKMLVGTYCFQMRIDVLQEDGFIMIGMGKENFHYNADAIPPDDYNCHGYTTVGEIYVCGKLIESSLEKLHEGDLVTMVVHFDDRSIVWYRNRHPVGFYEGFEGTSLYPCLVFGYKGYQASIVRASQLPHAIMKWMPDEGADAALEKRVILSNRNFTARSNSETGYTTVRTSDYFDIDNPYFEVEVEMLARCVCVRVCVRARCMCVGSVYLVCTERWAHGVGRAPSATFLRNDSRWCSLFAVRQARARAEEGRQEGRVGGGRRG